ncbi:hypothetical protein GCM10027048_39140 [Hymenobacter coalescens]
MASKNQRKEGKGTASGGEMTVWQTRLRGYMGKLLGGRWLLLSDKSRRRLGSATLPLQCLPLTWTPLLSFRRAKTAGL